MSELRECPFCGSDDIDSSFAQGTDITGYRTTYGAGCNDCGGCGPMSEEPEEAIKAWNQRHDR